MEGDLYATLKRLGLTDEEDTDAPLPKAPYVRPSFGRDAPKKVDPFAKPFGGFKSVDHSPFYFFGKGKKIEVENVTAQVRQATKGRVYTCAGPASSKDGPPQDGTASEGEPSFLNWNPETTSTNYRNIKTVGTGTTEKTHAPKGFIPPVRNLASIREDDDKCAEDYATVGDFDEKLVVYGIGSLKSLDTWGIGNFDPALMENILRAKYPCPRQVQRLAIPFILDGWDLLVCCETGSGKTAAYVIPIIQKCILTKAAQKFVSQPSSPFAVICVPTRELAHQIFEIVLKFTQNTGVTVAKLYGEYSVQKNFLELNRGCDILIATPGRFHQFFYDKLINLFNLHVLVLDEGDTLLGTSFVEDIDAIIDHEDFLRKGYYQVLLFGATFGEYSVRRASRYLRQEDSACVFSKKCSTNKLCIQEFQRVLKNERLQKLKEYLDSEFYGDGNDESKPQRILIFVNTQANCVELTGELKFMGYNATGIQGNQGQDSRLATFEGFRGNRVPIMVTTDLCARGIDIKDVDLVLNYELPFKLDTYIYRVGRVGRIREGRILSFVDPQIDYALIPDILQAMKVVNHPVSSVFDELVEEAKTAGQGFGNFGQDFGNTGQGFNQGFGNAGQGFGNAGQGFGNAGQGFGNAGQDFNQGFGNGGQGFGNTGQGFGNAGQDFNQGFGNAGQGFGNAGQDFNQGFGNVGQGFNEF